MNDPDALEHPLYECASLLELGRIEQMHETLNNAIQSSPNKILSYESRNLAEEIEFFLYMLTHFEHLQRKVLTFTVIDCLFVGRTIHEDLYTFIDKETKIKSSIDTTEEFLKYHLPKYSSTNVG
jgi:hypothetical protein